MQICNVINSYILGGSAPGGGGDDYGASILTDRTTVRTRTALPSYTPDVAFRDLDFDLDTIVQASGADFGSGAAQTEYSQQRAVNLDSTFMWISDLNGFVYTCPIDPATGEPLDDWEVLASAKASSVFWSGVTPGLIWYVDANGKKLYKKRIDLGTAAVEHANLETLLGTTNTYVGQVFLADGDDSYLTGEVRPGGSATMSDRQWFMLRLSDNVVIKNELMSDGGSTAGINGCNDAHVSPLGTWVYIASNSGGTKSEVQQIYHRPSNTIFNFGIRFQSANYDWGNGHNDLGEEYIVGEGANGNNIIATPLALLLTGGSVAAGIAAFQTGGVTIYESQYILQTPLVDYDSDGDLDPRNIAAGHHVCYKGGDWALISCYDQRTTGEWGAPTSVDQTQDEIFFVKVDIANSTLKEIRRPVKHHSISHTAGGSFNYEKLPRGNVSPDGRFIVYNSTLDVVNGTPAVLMTRVPAWGEPPEGESGGGILTNYALASVGATATASASSNSNLVPARTIDGYRHTNNNWNSPSTPGGGWDAANPNQWLEVDFGATRSIEQIDVITLADAINYTTEPTLSDTWTAYGIADFKVQYWNGASWVDIEVVTGNNKVWRQFTFTPVSTTKIRIYVTSSHARIVEVEAWG